MTPGPQTDSEPEPVRFWDLLQPAERNLLLGAGRRHVHPIGTVLMREGALARSVSVLLSGRVKIMAAGPSGHQTLLAIRVAGDILGELAAVDERRRSATVVAVDAVDVLRIPLSDFVGLLQVEAALSYVLLRAVTTKLRSATVRRVESNDMTIGQRVGAVISELAAEHGVLTDGEISITIPLSQDELAMMVGGSREAVVRTLRQLRADKVIRTARRQITVLRPERLRPG